MQLLKRFQLCRDGGKVLIATFPKVCSKGGQASASKQVKSCAAPCNCATVQYWFAFGRQALEGIVFSLFARRGAEHTGHLAVRLLHALLWGFGHCVIVTFAQEITRGCKSRRIALHAESFYNRKLLVILQQGAG